MGWVEERQGPRGTRFIAVYRDVRGAKRSAGTYRSEKEAIKAWHRAEEGLSVGKVGDPKRSRQTLARYAEAEWFPNHVIELTTRENYRYLLNRYVLPGLGHIRMVELIPHHVREWIADLHNEHGARPPTIREAKVVLDAILTTALNDQVVLIHAGRGVKTPPVARKPRRIITVEQYDAIYAALHDDTMRLLVETKIETGLRWGELTELRPRDLDPKARVLTVSRAVVELKARGRPDGVRFVVKDYPKDKEWRQLSLTVRLVKQIRAHIKSNRLGPGDLLFPCPAPTETPHRRPAQLPDPETLGLTQPNVMGRQYQHGTLTAYQSAPCRCRHCKDAVASYRAARRAAGRDSPRRPRQVHTDGHIPNRWFRSNIWDPAVAAADIGFRVTPHGLRHAHASWLLAGGADLQVVKERLGHGSIATTGKYLHALPGADQAALDALDAFRSRPAIAATPGAAAREDELSEMRDLVARLSKMLETTGESTGEARSGTG
ncbi:tyrosine-type recombinase/integrase [Sporichthya polymorpha]|uniref:tyrosine-type recombinase/integrase n=1 Tax=Sporichthya polymorpha TaxID=35751 RepID=UPI000380FBB0|nr:tyrosine-type recombinase/integrase [Sporichthya polymorpha]